MAYPFDEHPGKTLASSITLLRNLSEQEQESISGGFLCTTIRRKSTV
jgi:hypothetical protein